jgi:hypothetical protein
MESHDDLAVADQCVTTVIRFVEHGIHIPAPTDVLARLEDIMVRTSRLGDDTSGQERENARFQHAYAALLYSVYQQFLEMAPSG